MALPLIKRWLPLKCNSPERAHHLLNLAIAEAPRQFSALRAPLKINKSIDSGMI